MRGLFVAAGLAGFFACSPFGSDESPPAAASGSKPSEVPDAAVPDVVVVADAQVVVSSDGYAKSILSDEPIAYWRCREGDKTVRNEPPLADAHRATLGGNAKQRAGGLFPGGGECVFDGDYGEGAKADTLPTLIGAAYTLEAWMKLEALADTDYRHLFDQITSDRAVGLFFHDYGGAMGPSLAAEEFAPAHSLRRLGMPTLNDWHHVAMTAGVELFIDGVRIDAGLEHFGDTVSASYPLVWGAKSEGNRSIVGAMTEVAVYQKTLPPETIAAHYHLVRP